MPFIVRGRRDDIVHGGRKNDLLFSGQGDDEIHSGGGNDIVFAGSGNDVVDGGAGIDLVSTGRGDDVAVFVATENTGLRRHLPDIYDGGRGTDTLRIELTAEDWSREEIRADILNYLEFLEAGGQGYFRFHSLNLVASRFEVLDLVVDGVSVDPRDDMPQIIDLSGSSGNETVATGSGDDIVKSGSGNDVISTGDGDDLIESGAGDDIISIGDGDDVVRAGDGNDTIIAGEGGGDDVIDGGTGTDTVTYPSITFGIQIDLREADRSTHDLGRGRIAGDLLVSAGYAATTPVGMTIAIDPANSEDIGTDLLLGIEDAEGGKGDDRIWGNDLANNLYGSEGNDELDGFAGDDNLDGGAGDDMLFGRAGDDVLVIGEGIDVARGGAGWDSLVLPGASSEYTFTADGTGGYRIARTGEAPSEGDYMTGIEEVVFSDTMLPTWAIVDFNYIVGDDTAEVIQGTPGRDDIRAKGGDDGIYGGHEEDWITGGAGNDLIIASPNSEDDDNFVWDAVDYMREQDEDGGTLGVVVDLGNETATDTFGDTDTLVEVERINATNFADSLTGSDEDEGFDPHGGDDFIDGGDGYDSLMYQLSEGYGGTRGISAVFSSVEEGAGTVEDPFGDTDTFKNIEMVRGTSFDDVFMGGAGHQQFRGFEGNDTYDGGDGVDLVNYRNDAAYGGSGGISVDLSDLDLDGYASATDGFGDTDRLRNIENIRGTGAADSIHGDAAGNELRGEAGDDILVGRGGDDILAGGLGNDLLDGGSGRDYLDGGAGNDTLNGGTGDDVLVGGEGDDIFEFLFDSGNDLIEDFEAGIDALSLEAGLEVVAVSHSDIGGDSVDDTILELSSGYLITLLDTTVETGDLVIV